MKRLVLVPLLLLFVAACNKKKEISEIPLGNFDYRNQQVRYVGTASALKNGQPWKGNILTQRTQNDNGEDRWQLQIENFESSGSWNGQLLISDVLYFGNLQLKAYSANLVGATQLADDTPNEQAKNIEFANYVYPTNDVAGYNPRLIPGKPNNIVLESFNVQTGHFKGRFEITAKSLYRPQGEEQIRNGVFEGDLLQ